MLWRAAFSIPPLRTAMASSGKASTLLSRLLWPTSRETASDVEQQIHTLRAAGHGCKLISQRTGVSRSTVRRLLKGPETIPKTEPVNPAASAAVDAVL